jgi:hypothetical protein
VDGLTLYKEALAAGLEVRADGEHLVVRGPRRLSHLARELLAHKPEILAILAQSGTSASQDACATINDAEVAWRAEVMRSQVPPPPHAIGFLLARPELSDAWRELGSDHCHSCGEPLPPGHVVGIVPRCAPCCRAAERACNERREGVPPAAGGAASART